MTHVIKVFASPAATEAMLWALAAEFNITYRLDPIGRHRAYANITTDATRSAVMAWLRGYASTGSLAVEVL